MPAIKYSMHGFDNRALTVAACTESGPMQVGLTPLLFIDGKVLMKS